MKTRKNKKAGFTLVELMVVAIIVAILAAVAIPLMTGNKDRAMATEGQAGCTTIATQLKVHWLEYGNYAGITTDPHTLKGIQTGDLAGTYFADVGGYTINSKADGINYQITATGKGAAAGKTVRMTVTAGSAVWDGDLVGLPIAP